MTPWQDYKDALKDERELLEKQAEKHYSALEKLYDTAIKIFGGILAAALLIGGFFFGKTLIEVRGSVREQMQTVFRSQVEEEIKKQLMIEQKARKVVWVFSSDTVTASREIDSLRQVGLEEVEPVTDIAKFWPEQAGLVILSYDGSESGREKMGKIVSKVKPPVFLLIYTYNPDGKEIRLEEAERKILKGFDWYLPANFPATLVSHAKNLVLRGRGQ